MNIPQRLGGGRTIFIPNNQIQPKLISYPNECTSDNRKERTTLSIPDNQIKNKLSIDPNEYPSEKGGEDKHYVYLTNRYKTT